MRAFSQIAIAVFLLGLVPMSIQAQTTHAPPPVTLASLRDSHRPLLLFAPASNEQLQNQLHALSQSSDELRQRDIIVIPVLLNPPATGDRSQLPTGSFSPSQQAAIRKRLNIAPDSFTVVLIGKDGGEKFRASTPISSDKLFEIIDAMPMRQSEMRHKRPRVTRPISARPYKAPSRPSPSPASYAAWTSHAAPARSPGAYRCP